MGIPLAGWAIVAVSVIVVLYAAGHFGFKLYGDLQDALKQKALYAAQVKRTGLANDDTSSYTNAVTKEMDAHKRDGSGHQFVLHADKNGKTFVTFFDSDGCIALGRPGVPVPYQTEPQAILEWSLGPGKRPPSSPPSLPTPLNATNTPASFRPARSTERNSLPSDEIPVAREFSSNAGTDSRPRLIRVQAGCWNNGPHPWPFRTWWGPANGCWAPLYRQWNDGCVHYQMFNACNGQWDPRILWTFCNPQHHP